MKRIVLAMLGIVACGGGDGGGGAAIPIDELGSRVTEALCEYEVRCGWAPDKAACDESVFFRQQLVADVKAGTVIYDGKAAAACLDIYSTLGCKASDAGFFSVGQAQSCRDTVKGTVATGAACLRDEQCQSQSCNKAACATTAECCAGTCMARIALGGACSAANAECVEGLFCKQDSGGTTRTCTALIADGQPCVGSDVCVAGLRCNVVAGTSAGTCGVLPATGEACPGMACDATADVCDPSSKTCVARAGIGGDCAANPNGCVAYANCDAVTMKCVARKRAGEACAQLADCLSGVACTAGVCVPPPDLPACM